jgi:hypothetical protein
MSKISKSARIDLKKTFKVLHLPLDIGGNSQSISRGMNEVGIDSTSFALECGQFEYESDIRWGRESQGRVRREFLRFLSANFLFKYDIYCFNGGRTLFAPIFFSDNISYGKKITLNVYNLFLQLVQKLELKILRIRGCIIILIYQGDDARQGDFLKTNRKYSHALDVDSFYYSSRNDALKRKQIKLLDRYCDLIYALNPDLLKVLTSKARFLPYAVTIPTLPYTRHGERINERIVIGHAPTHRDAKGTKYVIEAVNSLQELGFEVELKLIENLSHSEAMSEYQSVDIILDQLLSGWYGAVAVESMLLSKPVICYIADEDLHKIPGRMAAELPIINADKYNLHSVIKQLLLLSPEERILLGEKHRKYALAWHSPKNVANILYRDIANL